MAAQTLLSHTAYNLIIQGRSIGNGLGVPVSLQRSAWEAEDAEASWQPAGGASPAFLMSSIGRGGGHQAGATAPMWWEVHGNLELTESF